MGQEVATLLEWGLPNGGGNDSGCPKLYNSHWASKARSPEILVGRNGIVLNKHEKVSTFQS